MTRERHISGDGFRYTAVYERRGANGPVYAIRFRQHEMYEDAYEKLWAEAVMVCVLFAGVIGWVYVGAWGIEQGIGSWLPIIVFIGILAAIWKIFSPPRMRNRSIEIDEGVNEFRIYRGKRLVKTYPLSELASLTVEPHPEVEIAKENRMLENRKGRCEEEKQHCLIGWFGIRGARKEVLITRHEWPPRNSLYEVQQAVEWTRDLAQQAKGTKKRRRRKPLD